MNDNDRTRVRLTNTLFLTQSLFLAAQIAIFTLMSIVSVDLSGRELLAGVPVTTLTLSQALTALPIGVFMGRFGRRLGLTVSYGTSVFGALLGVLAIVQGLFWLLLLSAVLMGMGRAGAEQSRFAAGDMFTAGRRASMIGRVVFAGTVGAIMGPLLVGPGGQLAVMFGLPANTGPWLVGMGVYSLAMMIIVAALFPDPMRLAAADEPDPQATPFDESTTTHPAAARSLPQLFRLPIVQLAVASMLLSQAVMTVLMVITPLHMSHFDYTQSDIALVIMAHTLGMFGLSGLTGYLIDRFGAINTMILGAVTLVISAVIAPASAEFPFLIVGLFLLGLGWNFGFIAGSTLLSATLRGAERARMQGAGDMLVAAAAAVGSLSSGPLFSVSGYVGVAGAGILVTLLLGWLIYLLGMRRSAKPAVEQI